MNCPKCGSKNSIAIDYHYLEPRNKCYICGTTHVKGWSHEALEKQVTGKVKRIEKQLNWEKEMTQNG